MEIINTHIDGLVILEPKVFGDKRGYFFESFSARRFKECVADVNFVQDNESRSSRGVLRGLHFQHPPYAQAKLVRCVLGSVLDICVDIRRGSPTYGQYAAVELSADNKRQLFIPHGFAHGFVALSDDAVFQYKCDNYYHPEAEGGIDILDPAIGIDFPFDVKDAVLSDKDRRHPLLAHFQSPFVYEK